MYANCIILHECKTMFMEYCMKQNEYFSHKYSIEITYAIVLENYKRYILSYITKLCMLYFVTIKIYKKANKQCACELGAINN